MSEPIVYEITEAGSDAMRYVAARNQAGAIRHVARRFKARALSGSEVYRLHRAQVEIEDATAKQQADLPTGD